MRFGWFGGMGPGRDGSLWGWPPPSPLPRFLRCFVKVLVTSGLSLPWPRLEASRDRLAEWMNEWTREVVRCFLATSLFWAKGALAASCGWPTAPASVDFGTPWLSPKLLGTPNIHVYMDYSCWCWRDEKLKWRAFRIFVIHVEIIITPLHVNIDNTFLWWK